VLVAIFVMGIGMLAVLAMFPLGAVNMARSIKDDRCAHSGANARDIATSMNICFNGNVTGRFTSPNGANAAGFQDALPDGPSFPVYVDPVGFAGYVGTGQTWVGGRVGLVRRTNVSFATGPPATYRWCTLLDDITFKTDGTPDLTSGSVDRAGKYSWAWLLRRPKAGVPTLCEMTVVVYEQRSLSRGAAKEVVFQGGYTAARANVITLFVPAGQVLAVKEGGWLLDATPVVTGGKNSLFTSSAHAKFYRVVNIGDLQAVAGGNNVDVELSATILNAADFAANTPIFVALDGVVEVFECGQVWKAWNN
jgi:hypothetical protein